MASDNVHVIKEYNRWTVRLEKDPLPQKVAPTQKEAIRLGREIAKNRKSELIVHGRDGRIKEKNSYGNDPKRIKG